MEPNNSDEDISKLCALLDFYSSRAVAHASFFVSSIFGLITFLAIVQMLAEKNVLLYELSTIAFLGFSYMGFYTLIRFGYYASLSQGIINSLKIDELLNKDTKLSDFFKRQNNFQRNLLLTLIIRKYQKYETLIIGFSYWVVIIFLGWFFYSNLGLTYFEISIIGILLANALVLYNEAKQIFHKVIKKKLIRYLQFVLSLLML
jgi:hypothetical protein